MRSALLLLVLIALPVTSWADSPPQCAVSGGGTASPPSRKVAVTILSMKLNSDMESDDNYIPGYDDRADVFGTVEINADGTVESNALPRIDESDFPHWVTDNRFVSRPAPVGQNVHVVIRLRESDWNYDDTVDTSPNAAKNDLEFDFNTCSLVVSGDVTGSASGVLEVTSGTGWNQGTLRFTVGMEDGRAASTTGDVALTGFDVIQVVPQVGRLVAGKPAVGVVTVANNTAAPQSVSARLRVFDVNNALIYDGTESLGPALAVGEVRSSVLAAGSPFVPRDLLCKGSKLQAVVDLLVPPGAETTGDPKTACWLINNSSGVKSWPVVTTHTPSLVWVRTGRLLTQVGPMSQLQTMHDLAMPFIRGVYPAAAVDDSVSTFPMVPPITGVVLDLFVDLLAAVGIPADAAMPYAILYELAVEASLVGIDRVMGVLPKEFFSSTLYGLWGPTNGLALGEWHPHAVIFEGETKAGAEVGPALMTPGHELGHTYGLSTDPTIKNWACNLTGDLGVIACGMGGGFDEYNNANHFDGVPTWGYWVPQMSGQLTSLTGMQCNSHCMMGAGVLNAEQDWAHKRHWVDAPDYDRLVDKLAMCGNGPTGSLYISGLIAGDDRVALGWVFSVPTQPRLLDFGVKAPEVPMSTPYAITLLDAKGTQLSESEIPLDWVHPETNWPVQGTFFGGFISYPAGTAKIQLWNRAHQKLLAVRNVSAHAPVVSVPVVSTHVGADKGRYLDVKWDAKDADGDKLTHFIHVSPDKGAHWWPIAHALTGTTFSVSLSGVASGAYQVRVSTLDGVNLTTSEASISL